MKLLSLVSTVALASSLSFAVAAPAKPADSLKIVKRVPKAAPAPAPVPVVKDVDIVEKRGGHDGGSDVDVNVDVDVKVKSGRPSYDYSPDDSGYGYKFDSYGNGPPSWVPDGWQCDIGWGPYKGWRCDDDWEPPSIFIKIWVKVSWWSPPSPWRHYWGSRWNNDWYRYGIPSNWNWKPRGYKYGGGYHGGGGWEESHGGYYWKHGDDYGGGYSGGGYGHGGYKKRTA